MFAHARFRQRLYQILPVIMERSHSNNDPNVDQHVTGPVNGDEVTTANLRTNRISRRDLLATAQIELDGLPNVNDNERSIIFCCFTSCSVFRAGLIIYWFWTLISIISNADIVFPALYFFPVISLLLALIGSSIHSYQLLIPIQLMAALDMLYASTEVFLLFNFKFHGSKDVINQFIRDKWPNKGKELYELSLTSYEMYLAYLIAKILYSTTMTLIIGQEITRYRVMKYIENRQQLLIRRRNWERDQQYRAFMAEAYIENPQRELFGNGLPPPPSYDVLNTTRIINRNAHTPPPSYSMIEQIEVENTVSNSPKESADATQLSTDPSTAMSPSSYLHSPLQ